MYVTGSRPMLRGDCKGASATWPAEFRAGNKQAMFTNIEDVHLNGIKRTELQNCRCVTTYSKWLK